MSLHLDRRQRAMLQEMGVRVWLPGPPAESMAIPAATQNVGSSARYEKATRLNSLQTPAPLVTASTQAVAPTPAPMPPAEPVDDARFSVLTRVASPPPADQAPTSWPGLQQTVINCQACAMCEGRRAPVLAAPTEAFPCDWMVVGEPPDALQERLGHPFAGESGKLLDKMLRAVGAQRFPTLTAAVGANGAQAQPQSQSQSPAGRAYLTNVLKCRPARVRAPVASELAACATYLRREIALVQPKVIVTMGRFAMQLLLSEMPPDQVKLPLGKLRGRVWQFAGVPVVVTYPPDYLLSNPQEKAKAWADLQLAMAVVRGDTPTPT